MADQRLIVITARFDGTTVATNTQPGWSVLDAAARYRTLVATGPVGRLGPDVLGSFGRTNRLVRVYADNPALGDVVQVFGAPTSPDADPVGQPRGPAVPIMAGPQVAHILELDFTDVLAVTTAVSKAVHVESLDLDEQQHLAWLLSKWRTDNECCAGDGPGPDPDDFEQRDVVVPPAGVDLLPLTTPVLYVDARFETTMGGELRLPLFASTGVGSRVVVRRDPGSGWFTVGTQGGDLLNASSFPVIFDAETQALAFERTLTGWTVVGTTTPHDPADLPLAATTSIPSPSKQTTRVAWLATTDSVLTLPLVAETPEGAVIIVTLFALTGFGATVIPQTGESTDGITNHAIPMGRVGDTLVFVRQGGGWVSTSNAATLARNLETLTAAIPGFAAHPGWRGVRFYRFNFAASAPFPLPTSPMLGTTFHVYNATAASVITLDAGPNGIVAGTNNGAATFALSDETPIALTFTRNQLGSGFWMGTR